jgi:uncharacterized protein
MRKFAMVVMMTLLVGITAWAQQPPQVTVRADTIYVGGDGRYEAAPDTAIIQFNIAAQEPELKDAYARATAASEQVRQVMRANGLDPKQAEIGFFQVAPVYDWKNPKRKVVGYRVSSSISLKVRDFSKIGPIADKFAEMDVTENQSINYTLDNFEQAKIRAVEDAFQKAKNSAEAVCRVSGRALGELSYASVDTFEQMPVIAARAPMAMKMSTMAEQAPTAEFSPQKVTVTAHVNVLFALK